MITDSEASKDYTQQFTALKGYVVDMQNRGFGLTTLQYAVSPPP